MLMGGARPQCCVRPAHTPAVYFRKQHFAFGNVCAGKSACTSQEGGLPRAKPAGFDLERWGRVRSRQMEPPPLQVPFIGNCP